MEQGPNGLEFHELVGALDSVRAHFFEHAQIYAENATQKNFKKLISAATELGNAFSVTVSETLALEATDEEKLIIVRGLLRSEDRERVDTFNTIAGSKICNYAIPAVDTDVSEFIESMDDVPNTILEIAIDSLSANLSSDISSLKNYAENKWRPKLMRIGREVLSRSQPDISLAASIALGIIIAKEYEKRRSS